MKKKSGIQIYGVGVYNHAHYVFFAEFKKRWHARLFHWLLNKSYTGKGTRAY